MELQRFAPLPQQTTPSPACLPWEPATAADVAAFGPAKISALAPLANGNRVERRDVWPTAEVISVAERTNTAVKGLANVVDDSKPAVDSPKLGCLSKRLGEILTWVRPSKERDDVIDSPAVLTVFPDFIDNTPND